MNWRVVVEEQGVVQLPADLLDDLDWKPDDDLRIEKVDDGFTIERVSPDDR